MEIVNRSRIKNPTYKKIYQLWYNMNARCHNPKNPYYKNYGLKGISVCEKWKTLDGFIDDIDKIDGFDSDLFLKGKLYLDKDTDSLNNKIYCLEKCRFVSLEESNKMKQHQQKLFVALSPEGQKIQSHNQSDFSRKYNLNQSKISECLRGNRKSHKGWTFNYL